MGISSLSFKVKDSSNFGHEYHVRLSTSLMSPWHADYGVYGSYSIPKLAKDWPSYWLDKPINRAINKIFLEKEQLHLNASNLLEYDTKENVDAWLKKLKEKIVDHQIQAGIDISSAELYLSITISSLSNTSLFPEQQT